ncbi:MAG: putative addiction module antidote protein [Methylobacter sp.]|nr:putative addiction module antidote protein [Methylobacter sp.]
MTEKFSHYDTVDCLKTDEDMALYFEACLEENDPALIAHALGVIAPARGMTQLAKDTGIGHQASCGNTLAAISG